MDNRWIERVLKKNLPPWLREVLLLRGTDLHQTPKYKGHVENPPQWRMPFPQKKGYTGTPSWLQQAKELGDPQSGSAPSPIMPDPYMDAPMDGIPTTPKPTPGPLKKYTPLR